MTGWQWNFETPGLFNLPPHHYLFLPPRTLSWQFMQLACHNFDMLSRYSWSLGSVVDHRVMIPMSFGKKTILLGEKKSTGASSTSSRWRRDALESAYSVLPGWRANPGHALLHRHSSSLPWTSGVMGTLFLQQLAHQWNIIVYCNSPISFAENQSADLKEFKVRSLPCPRTPPPQFGHVPPLLQSVILQKLYLPIYATVEDRRFRIFTIHVCFGASNSSESSFKSQNPVIFLAHFCLR